MTLVAAENNARTTRVKVRGSKIITIIKLVEEMQKAGDGSVALLNNEKSNVYKPIKILPDTGASQSLILMQALPFNKSSYSGDNVLIHGVNCEKFRSIPLCNLRL